MVIIIVVIFLWMHLSFEAAKDELLHKSSGVVCNDFDTER